MAQSKRIPRHILSILTLPLWGACGGEHGHHHEPESGSGGGHSHSAPHEAVGGMLIELGDHYAQLEVVPDFEAGELRLHCWDGHAESPVRLTQPSVEVSLTLGGAEVTLTLDAQASTLTGETVGDSSEFLVQDDRLKGLAALEGNVDSLDVLGAVFESIHIHYPDH